MCSRLFHLSAYKHYAEPFHDGAPLEFMRLMRVVTHTDPEPEEYDLVMHQGDVLVKINVRHLPTQTAIDDHLRWYGNLLREAAAQISGQLPITTRPQPAKLVRYLRLLDADAEGVHQHVVGPVLYPEKAVNSDGLQRNASDWHEFIKSRIRAARRFTVEGWMSKIES
ncbi:Uncharacterised protein [Xylophilus ampelinus]|nr:Uncharacterised protein [Xylophilus ampelinus]